MTRFRWPNAVTEGEEGHGAPLGGTLLGGIGAILLAIGAANDSGALAIVGGIVLAIGLTATVLLDHLTIDYGIFKRLDDLDAK